MKIRTLEDLNDELDRDLSWRRKELSIFAQQVSKSSGAAVDVFVRAGVALVYAHWEGFVKHTATSYVRFVGIRKLSSDELATPFIGQALRHALGKLGNNNNSPMLNQLVDTIFRSPSAPCPIPWTEEVNTRSNLSSEVLRDVIESLGLDYSRFETKSYVVDEQLLGQRNKIAHGKYLDVNREHFFDLRANVMALMEEFRNQVENAAALGKYKGDRVRHMEQAQRK